MSSGARLIWAGFGAATISFHLWLIFSGLVPNLVSRPLHMALALPWMLVFVARGRWEKFSGAVLAALGLAATLWIAVNQVRLSDQYGFLEGGL